MQASQKHQGPPEIVVASGGGGDNNNSNKNDNQDINSLRRVIKHWFNFHLFFLILNLMFTTGACFSGTQGIFETGAFVVLLFEFCATWLVTSAITDGADHHNALATSKTLFWARWFYIFISTAWGIIMMISLVVGGILLRYGTYYTSYSSYSSTPYYTSTFKIGLAMTLAGICQAGNMITAAGLGISLGKLRAALLGRSLGFLCGPPACDVECGCGCYQCCCPREATGNEDCCGPSPRDNHLVSTQYQRVTEPTSVSMIQISSGPASTTITTGTEYAPGSLEAQLHAFYSLRDPSRLPSIPEYLVFIKTDGIDAFNLLLRNKYGYDLNSQ